MTLRTRPAPAPEVDDLGRLAVRIVAPPADEPVAVTEGTETRGKRAVVAKPAEYVYDLRFTSDPFVDPDTGRLMVTLCTEQDWYRFILLGQPPRTATWRAIQVFMLP